jgi:hypothetical protein
VEYDGAGQPGWTGYLGSGNRVIQAAELALRRCLAEEPLGLPRLRGFHRLAAGHVRRHGTAFVSGQGHLHWTFSSQAAGCQPTDGQHSAKQQQEQCPEKFHGWDYSEGILFTFQGVCRLRR